MENNKWDGKPHDPVNRKITITLYPSEWKDVEDIMEEEHWNRDVTVSMIIREWLKYGTHVGIDGKNFH